jgi:methionyl-tRNA formyltransferase
MSEHSRPSSLAPSPFQEERIVFMGTPDFAVASLAALVDAGCNVVAVITAPDRPAGRGMKLQPSAVKQYAASKGIAVLQPTNLKSEVFLEELRSFRATLQVVVAFRMLPEVVWNMPPKGTFNLHASLLPQYRGAAPINHAIINGESETGVTTFFLQHQIDTGNIILQEKTPIGPDETAGELHDRLMSIGAKLVVETVRQIAAGTVKSFPQTEARTHKEAPKIFKEHCLIDWTKPAEQVHDLVRGMSPYPAAHTLVDKQGESLQLKIYRTTLVDGHGDYPGTISSDGRSYMEVACGNGAIRLIEMQLAGKKRMGVSEFLNGQSPDSLRIITEN